MNELLAAAAGNDLESVSWPPTVFAFLLAFGLGQAIALAYIATFRGLSYSRAMVHAMALCSVVTACSCSR